MGHTKNHRRNNKKRQTKKYRVGGGFSLEDSLKDAAKDEFVERVRDKNGTLKKSQYDSIKLRMPDLPDFSDVDTDNSEGIDLNEFTAAYIFTIFAKGKTLSENNYKKLQNSLPKFNNVPFSVMDEDTNGSIEFKEFLKVYNNPTTGGRRRRKRSTRNKRKTNKKRRTVKRRKSAKRSRRRK